MRSTAPVEKELKYALTAKGYARLVAAMAGPGSRTVVQQNVYFDDAGFRLRRRRFGLRIRIVDGRRAQIALKFPAMNARAAARLPVGYKVRNEVEQPLPLATARAIIHGRRGIESLGAAPIRKLRELLGAHPPRAKERLLKGGNRPARTLELAPIGQLRTQRTTVPWISGLELEIDRCEARGRVFYELEVETARAAATDRAIRKLFARLELPYRPLKRSKLARLFRSIGRGKGG
jgi:uncharacterized protein YjbK